RRLGHLAQGGPTPSSIHVLHSTCVSIHKPRGYGLRPGDPLRPGDTDPTAPQRRGLPPGRADAALLWRDRRLRVLALRVRARTRPAADRTALLLHRARRVLGAVVGRRGPHRDLLRPARAPPAPDAAAVVVGGRHRG